ncbi:methionine ABC transporter permease [uncultured Flavonifractor sp.]|uniref:methionine ABC transporter permease n=1 Tax=uncultured Flavonifractor sp. TaxID=1193534 RepID=UPI001747F4B7|nr:methionine ABC transporter permease [uncultured Flavonifractor sp.]
MLNPFNNPEVQEQLSVLFSNLAGDIWATLYSTVLATIFAYIIGLPLGILLVTGEKGGVRPLPGALMKVLNFVINILRSVPFLILMIMAIPLSRLILGTSVGTNAMIPPLVIAAFPFVARMVESSLREVDHGVLEAAQAMGASPFQIVRKVLLPEALPSLLTSATTVTITILGYGAMAGIIGGNGLGATAINYGYYRNQPVILYGAVIVLVILVQIIQSAGTHTAVGSDKRLTKKSRRKGLRDANRQVNRDKRTPGAM